MIGNILDNTTELYMIKYTFGEIFSSGGATLCKNHSDQTVSIFPLISFNFSYGNNFSVKKHQEKKNCPKISAKLPFIRAGLYPGKKSPL